MFCVFRVLMRREQIHKICLNHALVPEITYKLKDDKTWLFYANDFSEGEVVLQHFCLRFKNKEIAMQFKDAIDKALSGKKDSSESTDLHSKNTDSEEVVFITEIKASSEEKQKAKELMLPEHFYTYKNKDPCPGCRGCDDDDNNKVGSAKELQSSNITLPVDSTTATPIKNSALIFQSPTGSVYGTPSNFERSTNTTMYRTPLTDLKSNITQVSSLATSTFSFADNDLTDKENTLTDSPKPVVSQPLSFVSGGVLQNQATATKTSILAPPKLSTLQSALDNTTVTKSGFSAETTSHSTDQNKTVFGENKFDSTGLSTNKSIFSFNPPSNKEDSQTTSLFSDTNFSQVNFFSNNSQEGLFGPAALKNMQAKPPLFETGKFSFGNVTEQNQDKPKTVFGAATTDEKKASDSASKVQLNQNNVKTIQEKPIATTEATSEKSDNALSKDSEINKSVELVRSDPGPKDTLFKIDNSLTFENLSSSGPGFSTQSKYKLNIFCILTYIYNEYNIHLYYVFSLIN